MTASQPAGTPRPATTGGDAYTCACGHIRSRHTSYQHVCIASVDCPCAQFRLAGSESSSGDVCARLVAWADGDRDAATLRALVDDARAAVQATDGSA